MSAERMPEATASAGTRLPRPGRTMGVGALGLDALASGALGWRREVAGFATAVIVGPLLSWLLFSLRSQESITYEVLSYQLLVVIVAIIGGLRPAVFTAVLSGIALDLLFVAPVFTIAIEHPLHIVALVLYVIIAILVGLIVAQAANRARAAQRATAEAELLVSIAGNVLRGDNAVLALITRTREAFGLSGVRLVAADGEILARDGEPVLDGRETTVPVGWTSGSGPRAFLELHGGPLDAPSRRLVEVIVAQLSAAIEHTDLSVTAREVETLAATDQVRTALLSALSHDLRRPLSVAVAAIGGLRGAHELSTSDRDELLATADESLATLSTLITDLLDVSRVQAGVLAVSATRVDAEGSILSALDELSLGPADVELALELALPPLHADPVLLQRVLVNLLANALTHSQAGGRVTVAANRTGERAEIRIIDHGEGVPLDRQDGIFQPFQRFGDTDNTTGLGLGLALSKGFTEGMGGSLTPEDTPGGGLTMVISLPLAAEKESE